MWVVVSPVPVRMWAGPSPGADVGVPLLRHAARIHAMPHADTPMACCAGGAVRPACDTIEYDLTEMA